MTPRTVLAAIAPLTLALAFALSACAAETPAQAPAPAAGTAAHDHATPATLPRVVVHKSPTCGCCSAWVDHLRDAGFAVDVVETAELDPVRRRVGVPVGKASCHTAEVDGYFVEGHVPADDVKRLLAERPDARGLTAPGMPAGSPGMEVPSGATPPYSVLLVAHDGSTTEFARHGDGAGAARFATDAVLREQMAGIRAAVGELAHHEMGHMGVDQARAFAVDIEARVQSIIAECTLPPDADAALHAIIVPLLNHAVALKTTPADAAAVAPMRAALAEYARRFDDPGFAAGE